MSCKEIANIMKEEFEVRMMVFLRFKQSKQVNGSSSTNLNMQKNHQNILGRPTPCGTPMSPSTKFDEEENCIPFDETRCRSMIGSLSSLPTSGLDVTFSVCLCARE